MSNPIEVMAKAIADATCHYGVRLNKLREDGKHHEIYHVNLVDDPVVDDAFHSMKVAHEVADRMNSEHQARAALLALSDCDLPEEVTTAGAKKMGGILCSASSVFRAMLKQLAENGA